MKGKLTSRRSSLLSCNQRTFGFLVMKTPSDWSDKRDKGDISHVKVAWDPSEMKTSCGPFITACPTQREFELTEFELTETERN